MFAPRPMSLCHLPLHEIFPARYHWGITVSKRCNFRAVLQDKLCHERLPAGWCARHAEWTNPLVEMPGWWRRYFHPRVHRASVLPGSCEILSTGNCLWRAIPRSCFVASLGGSDRHVAVAWSSLHLVLMPLHTSSHMHAHEALLLPRHVQSSIDGLGVTQSSTAEHTRPHGLSCESVCCRTSWWKGRCITQECTASVTDPVIPCCDPSSQSLVARRAALS